MIKNAVIRKIRAEESQDALALVWRVFQEYEAPDYSREGVEEFYQSIHDEAFLDQLDWNGAFLDDGLIGVIATRNKGKHIALFFVDGRYQGQGIGRKLFESVKIDHMTVNSSPYSLKIYRKLGFTETDEERSVNGLRFIPMELK